MMKIRQVGYNKLKMKQVSYQQMQDDQQPIPPPSQMEEEYDCEAAEEIDLK